MIQEDIAPASAGGKPLHNLWVGSFYTHTKYKSCEIIGASTQISGEGLGVQAVYPCKDSVHSFETENPVVWNAQGSYSQWVGPAQGSGLGALTSSEQGWDHPSHLFATTSLGPEHTETGFNVYTAGFWSHFALLVCTSVLWFVSECPPPQSLMQS